MKIAAVSDTHLRSLSSILKGVEADVLIHAGDWTGRGTVGELTQIRTQLENIRKQFQWIIYIAGNHDFLFQKNRDLAKSILEIDSYILYLEDSETRLRKTTMLPEPYAPIHEKLTIYGSPWQPWFHDWAFNLQRGAELREKWLKIPEGLDILITHGPPYGIMDSIDPTRPDCLGDWDLRDIVKKVKPKHHVFGHIHQLKGSGKHEYHVESGEENGTHFWNVAVCDEDYLPTHPVTVFEI